MHFHVSISCESTTLVVFCWVVFLSQRQFDGRLLGDSWATRSFHQLAGVAFGRLPLLGDAKLLLLIWYENTTRYGMKTRHDTLQPDATPALQFLPKNLAAQTQQQHRGTEGRSGREERPTKRGQGGKKKRGEEERRREEEKGKEETVKKNKSGSKHSMT